MGILDNLVVPKRAPECKVRTTADRLDAADAKKLLEAVEGSEWSVLGLVKALDGLGVPLSRGPMTAHRARECSCFRS